MAAKDKIDEFITGTILDQPLEDIVGERFGRYSKYIIQDRAIPDVRDGLKPVQRRILYAMYLLKTFSNTPFKKCARICGEVMGKFHPHGDSSIYEALIRMSQWWKMGVPLIEVHGNNGSIDGDSAAAYRYTETRLSKNAEYMLADIEKKTVNFTPNFDDEELEPTVLPSKFPNILVNGSTGISSGYATNIPPHNLSEIIDATIYLINHPNMTIDDLLDIVKGPDFPTGGIVQGLSGIRDAFLTGRGKVFVRSKTHFEELKDGSTQIVVTEIPYEVNKAMLVKRIDQMRIDHVLDDIVEVRDESDREGLRIAIDLKKNANRDAILTYLFKNTDLQISYNYNMVAICNRRPMTLGMIDILKAYVMHQKEIITNRSNFELEKAKKRIHILEGLIKMVDVLEEVIAEIRSSNGKADSKMRIMNRFGFTEFQAEAIVTLQLYRLSNTDVNALLQENDELHKTVAYLEKVLSSEKELLKIIVNELTDIKNTIGAERKTAIEHEVSDLKIDETNLISKEDVMICVTKDGYLKRSSLKSYQQSTQCGLKEGDAVLYERIASTLDTLVVFTSRGNYFYIPVYKMSEVKWKDLGDHLSAICQMDKQKNERVIEAILVNDFKESVDTILLTTKSGLIKQVALKDLEVSRYSKSVRCMKITDDDEVVSVSRTDHTMEVVVVTHNAEVLRFRASELGVYGTNASGVKAILLKPKDYVVSAFYTNQTEDILFFTSRNYVKRMKVSEFSLYKRARSGAIAIKFIKANPHYVVSAKAMSPLQYKESVKVNLVYTNGSMYQEVYDFKYNVSDAGKAIEINMDNVKLEEPYQLIMPERTDKEPFVDDSYLIVVKEVQTSIFDISDDTTSATEEVSTTSILDDLDSILAQEAKTQAEEKPQIKSSRHSVIIDDEGDDEEGVPVFKKVNLFGEEQ